MRTESQRYVCQISLSSPVQQLPPDTARVGGWLVFCFVSLVLFCFAIFVSSRISLAQGTSPQRRARCNCDLIHLLKISGRLRRAHIWISGKASTGMHVRSLSGIATDEKTDDLVLIKKNDDDQLMINMTQSKDNISTHQNNLFSTQFSKIFSDF